MRGIVRSMKMKELHLICNAHLDPVWQWRWQEGSVEAKATLRSALDRIKEFPEFIFVYCPDPDIAGHNAGWMSAT